MFEMTDFIKDNLIRGYWDGSFSEPQVNIFAMNYLMRAMITQDDFNFILEAIQPREVEGII